MCSHPTRLAPSFSVLATPDGFLRAASGSASTSAATLRCCSGLPDDIVAKVHALPHTPYVGHWDVAFTLRDGSVVDDIELGFAGSIVMRVNGEPEFTLDPSEIVDVIDPRAISPTDANRA